jgi:hypothetical protein
MSKNDAFSIQPIAPLTAYDEDFVLACTCFKDVRDTIGLLQTGKIKFLAAVFDQGLWVPRLFRILQNLHGRLSRLENGDCGFQFMQCKPIDSYWGAR